MNIIGIRYHEITKINKKKYVTRKNKYTAIELQLEEVWYYTKRK
jgi:hypothetical protein